MEEQKGTSPSPSLSQQPSSPSAVKQRKKEKNYSCTPRQLEALRKAREAKRLKSQQASSLAASQHQQYHVKEEEDQVESDMRYVANPVDQGRGPVPVVRDNKFLKEFLETERISAQETGLGKIQRDEGLARQGLDKLQELNADSASLNPLSAVPEGSSKVLLGVGIGVGCGLGLAYWASCRGNRGNRGNKNEKTSAKAVAYQRPAEPKTQASPSPSPPEEFPVLQLKAPWEQ